MFALKSGTLSALFMAALAGCDGGSTPACPDAGVIADHIARWDGAAWHPMGQGLNDAVAAIAVDSSTGRIYAGGRFRRSGATDVRHVACWDPTVGKWKSLGSGLDDAVRTLAFAEGGLYAGGAFTTAVNDNGATVECRGLAKWDGTRWQAVDGAEFREVTTLVVASGRLYVAGVLNSGAGAILSIDLRNPGPAELLATADRKILTMCVVDSLLYAGGYFSEINGVPVSYLARFNFNTGTWDAIDGVVPDLDPRQAAVYTLFVHPPYLYISGDCKIDLPGSQFVVWLARWNTETEVWSAFPGAPIKFATMAHWNNRLYIGGAFNEAGGLSDVFNIASFDPSSGSWGRLGCGLCMYEEGISAVHEIVPTRDGVLVGGEFDRIGED